MYSDVGVGTKVCPHGVGGDRIFRCLSNDGKIGVTLSIFKYSIMCRAVQ